MNTDLLARLLTKDGPSVGLGGGASLLGLMGGVPGIGLSLLPLLLSALGGDPQRAQREKIMQLLSPEYLQQQQQKILRLQGASPDIVSARNSIIGSGNSLTNQLQRSFAARGLGTTGIAAAALPIARTATAGRLTNFSADLSNNALSRAQGLVQDQVAGLQGNPYGQSRFQSSLGDVYQAYAPLLRKYFQQRYSPGVAY